MFVLSLLHNSIRFNDVHFQLRIPDIMYMHAFENLVNLVTVHYIIDIISEKTIKPKAQGR